jgi:ABC-type nitrate/sulfonate/bicarbonate transport system substrate-binding protein
VRNDIKKPKALGKRLLSGGGLIRIGYVPLIDAAPLLIADSLGLFHDAGLNVRVERELGWGSIREKIVYGELEAAHAPAGLMFSILCGLNSRPHPVSTDLILNLQGNAITLSRRFWDKGVRDAVTLRQLLRSEAPRKPVFAVVSPISNHLHLLRNWLRSSGIDPDRHVRFVVLPPPLVGEHMKDGHIDGFCVGEPWNSASAFDGDGWIIATSAELAPLHPEKILLASDALREQRSAEYALLREALIKACKYCDTLEGRNEVVDYLHSRKLFTVSKEVLANSLIGPFQRGTGQEPDKTSFLHFSRNEANRATHERALWLLDSLSDSQNFRIDGAQRRECLKAVHDLPSVQLGAKSSSSRSRSKVTQL